jgi:UDP:flavonoid glycosyltransferase YjiC (YdhE family)
MRGALHGGPRSVSRFLLTWELGLNLGHLARLQPVAARLRARGHSVLVAAREIPAAASWLGPAGVPFVQAPHLPQGLGLMEQASGYADLLLSQGWSDPQILWGLVQSWHSVFHLFRPDVVVTDHSPTARLATRIADVPTVMMGNGFELPPDTDPLPPFPGLSWATAEKATTSERIAVKHANQVLKRFDKAELRGLSELFREATRLYVTFPELDPYGVRRSADYIGPILPAPTRAKVDWPQGSLRIFASLRPDTAHAETILEALKASEAAVIAFTPGFTPQPWQRYDGGRIRFISQLVDLPRLAPETDACVSYGAEGTVVTFLLAGVPQLLSPRPVEAHMAARQIEALGAAVVLGGIETAHSVTDSLQRVCKAPFKKRAVEFAYRRREYRPEEVADQIADRLEAALVRRQPDESFGQALPRARDL